VGVSDRLDDGQAQPHAVTRSPAREWKGSKSEGTWSSGKKGPLLTTSRKACPSEPPERNRIQPPRALWRTALSTSFPIMRSKSTRSPVASGRLEISCHGQIHVPNARGGVLERVFGRGGQVHELLGADTLVAVGQREQGVDHLLSPVDRSADLGRSCTLRLVAVRPPVSVVVAGALSAAVCTDASTVPRSGVECVRATAPPETIPHVASVASQRVGDRIGAPVSSRRSVSYRQQR
jgi:hypothetical protein